MVTGAHRYVSDNALKGVFYKVLFLHGDIFRYMGTSLRYKLFLKGYSIQEIEHLDIFKVQDIINRIS